MKRILALIRKELIGVWRDPKSRMSLLAPPLVQLLIFTFAATLDVKNVSRGCLISILEKRDLSSSKDFKDLPRFLILHTCKVKEKFRISWMFKRG